MRSWLTLSLAVAMAIATGVAAQDPPLPPPKMLPPPCDKNCHQKIIVEVSQPEVIVQQAVATCPPTPHRLLPCCHWRKLCMPMTYAAPTAMPTMVPYAMSVQPATQAISIAPMSFPMTSIAPMSMPAIAPMSFPMTSIAPMSMPTISPMSMPMSFPSANIAPMSMPQMAFGQSAPIFILGNPPTKTQAEPIDGAKAQGEDTKKMSQNDAIKTLATHVELSTRILTEHANAIKQTQTDLQNLKTNYDNLAAFLKKSDVKVDGKKFGEQ